LDEDIKEENHTLKESEKESLIDENEKTNSDDYIKEDIKKENEVLIENIIDDHVITEENKDDINEGVTKVDEYSDESLVEEIETDPAPAGNGRERPTANVSTPQITKVGRQKTSFAKGGKNRSRPMPAGSGERNTANDEKIYSKAVHDNFSESKKGGFFRKIFKG